MTGTITQFVSLTCHGNAFVRGMPLPTFWPSNSTFQFCDRVNFVEFAKTFLGKWKEKAVAENPRLLFDYLRGIGTRGLRLLWRPANNEPDFPDRMAAAF